MIDTEELAPQDFLRYALSHPWIDKIPDKYKNHPMCPGCEQIALRDQGWTEERRSHCPNCHRTFKATLTFYEYMQEKLYRR